MPWKKRDAFEILIYEAILKGNNYRNALVIILICKECLQFFNITSINSLLF